MRSLLALLPLLLGLLALRPARADVVILEGNDVPLTGRILSETEDALVFRIKGLGRTSHLRIEKSRVKSFWREENSYWDYVRAEEERRAALERLKAPRRSPAPAAAPAPAAPKPAPARSGAEIRRDYFDRTLARTRTLVPDQPLLRLLLFLAALGAVTLILFAGSRVADLPKLRLGKSALLAVVTVFLVVLAAVAPGRIIRPEAGPLLILSEALLWILVARMLSEGTVSKAVLLLSFFLAALFVLGSSAFSVLTAV